MAVTAPATAESKARAGPAANVVLSLDDDDDDVYDDGVFADADDDAHIRTHKRTRTHARTRTRTRTRTCARTRTCTRTRIQEGQESHSQPPAIKTRGLDGRRIVHSRPADGFATTQGHVYGKGTVIQGHNKETLFPVLVRDGRAIAYQGQRAQDIVQARHGAQT